MIKATDYVISVRVKAIIQHRKDTRKIIILFFMISILKGRS